MYFRFSKVLFGSFFYVAVAQTAVKISVCLTLQSVPIRYGGSLFAVTRVDTKAGILFLHFWLLLSQAKQRKVTLACCRTNFST